MKKSDARRRSAPRSPGTRVVRYFPKIRKVVTPRGRFAPTPATPPTPLEDLEWEEVAPEKKEEVAPERKDDAPMENEEATGISDEDVDILRRSLRDVEKKMITRELHCTCKKLRKFRRQSLRSPPPTPGCVHEDTIIPRVVIREGELDSTVVHVTKGEDLNLRRVFSSTY